ncbi:chaplin [Streptomyces alboniger]|uniref:Chaplin n=1 Tax=Streptomyces alboniger TaxID=132473 RepID=A0A5J6HG80_STRAD|nr:chaplin [Streptomyces alboniger]QEV19289.1 chaplin [Streptomyces alboniger]
MYRIAKAAAATVGTGAVVLGGAGLASADAGAQGQAVGSPGVLSGNLLQVPIHVPVNLCGNTVDIIGLLNPTFGNQCVNKSDKHHHHGGGHHKGDDHKGGGRHHGGYGG